MGEPRSTGMKWSCVTESRREQERDYLDRVGFVTPVNHGGIFPTSFQKPNPHGGDLDDVFIVTDVSCKHSGSLGGKSTRVQLHYLLTSLKDLPKIKMRSAYPHYRPSAF